MDNNTFQVLTTCIKSEVKSQRSLAKLLDISLGYANKLYSRCYDGGLLDSRYNVTEEGLKALKPYKVDNAIIMAAGMGSGFAPLSYEIPKGLLLVKGEVMIERQIRQLREAGVENITVVVGYMKEQFFYLGDRFGVDIVVNEDYRESNNTSTLLKVMDRLRNTYICSSDDYFVDNVFEAYVFRPYYSSVYFEDASMEWTLNTDVHGRITSVNLSPEKGWIMLGHVYIDSRFSEKLRVLLKENKKDALVNSQVWEYLLANHLDELEIYIRKYDADKVLEFDCLDSLKAFDSKYLKNSGSRIFENICQVLRCTEDGITDVEVIKNGYTKLSFSFSAGGEKYVYSQPGGGYERETGRKAEAYAEREAAKLGFDDSFIYMNPEKGWKIRRYIKNSRHIDMKDPREIRYAVSALKKLHDKQLISPADINIWKKIEREYELLCGVSRDYAGLEEMFDRIRSLYALMKKESGDTVLCHGGISSDNLLLDENGRLYIINWESSGNAQPVYDLAGLICSGDYSFEEVKKLAAIYYGREAAGREVRMLFGYVSVEAFYRHLWAIYREYQGNEIGERSFTWYKTAKRYLSKAEELYAEE